MIAALGSAQQAVPLSDARMPVLLRTGVLALLHRQIWRESPDGRCCSWRSVAVFRSLHTHFIELQPSHTLEQVPSLVLAKQRWNVSEACRLLDDAAHPTHSTNLRSGSVSRSCWGRSWRDGRLLRGRTRRLGGHNKSDAQDR